MLRRRLALLLVGLVPVLAGCPAQPGSPSAATADGAVAPAPAAATWQSEMLDAVNANRAAAGKAPLSLCGTLNVAAQGHSADQAAHDTMSHTGSDGSNLGDRAGRAGYLDWRALGENVAYGYPSVGSVMAGWMNSSGHRANILGAYQHVGFGRATSASGTEYWTQDFGSAGTC